MAKIREAGGTIVYDFETFEPGAPRRPPEWLIVAMGVDYVATARRVDLGMTQFSDTGLHHIKVLTGLKWLSVSGD